MVRSHPLFLVPNVFITCKGSPAPLQSLPGTPHPHPPSPSPGNHSSAVCLCGSTPPGPSRLREPCSMCPVLAFSLGLLLPIRRAVAWVAEEHAVCG